MENSQDIGLCLFENMKSGRDLFIVPLDPLALLALAEILRRDGHEVEAINAKSLLCTMLQPLAYKLDPPSAVEPVFFSSMLRSFLDLQEPGLFMKSLTKLTRVCLLVFSGPALLQGCDVNDHSFN